MGAHRSIQRLGASISPIAAAKPARHERREKPMQTKRAINSWSLQVAARRELILGDGTLNDGGSDPGPQVAKSPILRLEPFSSRPVTGQRSKNSCA
jgi:hypothetical protein